MVQQNENNNRNRLAEELKKQKIAYIVGGSLIGIIILIVLIGYFREFYAPPRVVAGEVRGVTFTMGDLVQRIRILQGLNRYQEDYMLDLSTTPFEFLQKLVHVEILKQAAPGLGISVSDTEIEDELKKQFYPVVQTGQETGSNQLDQEFQSNYSSFLTATNLTKEEYESILAEVIRERKLTLSFFMTIESPQPQTEISLIVLDRYSGTPPEEIRGRIDSEGFENVAQELNQEDGYFGWVPAKAFPEFNQFLYPEDGELPDPDTISAPIIHDSGVFIVKVLSYDTSKEVEDPVKYKLAVEAVKTWQDTQLQTGSEDGWVKLNFNSDKYAWVTNQVKLTAPRTNK
tara:strand:+ start:922 stop:1950 length:1029 start_codon:yes stop_codon:yes gene_type:complete